MKKNNQGNSNNVTWDGLFNFLMMLATVVGVVIAAFK